MSIIPSLYTPLTIDSTNNKIYFKQASPVLTGTLASGVYYDPETLITSAAMAMKNAAAGTWTGTFRRTDGKAVFDCTVFTIRILSGSPASCHELLGWHSPDTAAHTPPVTSSHQIPNYWSPDIPVEADSFAYKKVNGSQHFTLNGNNQYFQVGSNTVRDINFITVPVSKVIKTQTGSFYNESFEDVWDKAKTRMRYWPDRTVTGTYEDYFLTSEIEDMDIDRSAYTPSLFNFKIKLGKVGG